MITKLRHKWPEKAGFSINRPHGLTTYTFLLFWNSVELRADGHTLETAPGAFIIYPPHVPQWFLSRSPLLHDWLHTTADEAGQITALQLPQNQVFYPHNLPQLHTLFRELEPEVYGSRPFRDELLQLKFRELLLCLAREQQEPDSVGPIAAEEQERMRRLRQQMLLQPERDWTVTEMAQEVNLSVSRFHAVYKAVFGASPMSDRIHARINAAENRLLMSDDTATDIAAALGYRSVCHFTRQFRDVTGLSPLSYRKKYR